MKFSHLPPSSIQLHQKWKHSNNCIHWDPAAIWFSMWSLWSVLTSSRVRLDFEVDLSGCRKVNQHPSYPRNGGLFWKWMSCWGWVARNITIGTIQPFERFQTWPLVDGKQTSGSRFYSSWWVSVELSVLLNFVLLAKKARNKWRRSCSRSPL